jgi:serine/threonine protein kinase
MMSKPNWEAGKELFHEAIDLTPAEREAFLSENCQDKKLRREVEELLLNYEESEDFIKEPAIIGLGLFSSNKTRIGEKIGRYEIVSEIGRGGMGVVYEASRHDDFEQKVALKIIKRGMDTDFILKRFQTERQILAGLNHPNIARLHDGGTTDDGLPYFVMEFIEGQPFLKFCDSHSLKVEERLKLFREVCSAVSYAHQNLIVHRDLKPSNILITAQGTPKLLDFGIAKIINPESEGLTAPTDDLARIFTPEYASPEQIRGERITTSSDVYSLGVILYELLSGKNPFRRKNQTPHQWMQEICETVPEKPSDVMTRRRGDAETNEDSKEGSKGSRGKTHPPSPIPNPKLLRGDLDNIIIKALKKEVSRRYYSVEQFSEDIRRHLEGLPVIAQTDSVRYRLQKFAKRHRVGVFAGGLIFLSLLTGISATAWEAYRANLERAKAENRFNDVRKLANSVLFEYHDGIAKLAGSTAIREKMVKDALEYLDDLSAENEIDSNLKSELAQAYVKVGDVQGNPYQSNLGNLEGAIASYQKALAIMDDLLRSNPTDLQLKAELAKIYSSLGDVNWAKGQNEESLTDYQKALRMDEELAALDSQNQKYQNGISYSLNGIGHVQSQLGDFQKALEAFQKFVQISEMRLAADPANPEFQETVAGGRVKLGDVQFDNQDYRTALTNYESAAKILTGLALADQTNARILRKLALADGRLATTSTRSKQDEKAVEFDRQALEQQKKIARIDPDDNQIHAEIASAYGNLAGDFINLKNYSAAEENIKQALWEFEGVLQKNPGFVQIRESYGTSLATWAQILAIKGDSQKALEIYQRSANILEDEKIRKRQTLSLVHNYQDSGKIQLALATQEKAVRFEHLKKSQSFFQKCLETIGEMPDSNPNKTGLQQEISEKLIKIKVALKN